MLTQLCGYLRNWFTKEQYFGHFRIHDGRLSPLDTVASFALIDGQYIRIVGSTLNDGIYQWHSMQQIEGLQNEDFTGAVWALAIPKEVVALADEIKAWNETAAKAASSPYSSENLSAGGYSYSKASGDSLAGLSWMTVFAPKLDQWRKI